MSRFQGKQVLITGGTRGIGAAIATAFAASGAEVLAAGVDPDEVAAFRTETGLPGEVLDVTDESAITRIVARLPRIDYLINADGIIMR